MARTASPLEEQIARYRNLVAEEERRVRELTIRKFTRMHHIVNAPSLIVGKTYQKSLIKQQAMKDTLRYLKGRYYRLKGITVETIQEAAFAYSFEDYKNVIESFVRQVGKENDPKFQRLQALMNRMDPQAKRIFIDKGFNKELRQIYRNTRSDERFQGEMDRLIYQMNYAIEESQFSRVSKK
jgi:hypothetical protein